MKTKLCMLTAVLCGFFASAQTVLFEQSSGGVLGFPSVYAYQTTPIGLYVADDFSLTADSQIQSMTFYGIQNNGDLLNTLTGFSVYVYADASDAPSGNPSVSGDGLLEIIDLPVSDPAISIDHSGISYDITVDIAAATGSDLTLDAGTYWVVPVAHQDVDPATVTITAPNKLWCWWISDDANLSSAAFIDPANFLGANFTSWTSISAMTGSSSTQAMAFTVEGENLGVAEHSLDAVKLYPNPVSATLHVQLPASLELQSVTLSNMMGQTINVELGANHTLDMSQMASGIYFLKLQTQHGVLTKKIVKQ